MASNANKKDRTKAAPKALECVCDSPYQDKRYGTNMRLHNPKADVGGTLWRCSVCGRER